MGGIFISGSDAQGTEVVASSIDTFFVIHLLPAFAGIVGAVDTAAFLGVGIRSIDPRIHAIGIARGDARTAAADTIGISTQSFGHFFPALSAIARFLYPAYLAPATT